ncbi:hypothetical protein D3C75_1178450 [compost metagenome]
MALRGCTSRVITTIPFSAWTGKLKLVATVQPTSRRLKMPLSNVPTMAIPSSVRCPCSALRGREQKVCRFLFIIEKQWVDFIRRHSQKKVYRR